MPVPSDTDWAYAAGFVDGEGCIAIVRQFNSLKDKFTYSVSVVVANRERSVLDWMQQIWSGWVVNGGGKAGYARSSFAWRSPSGTNSETFLRGIRPWLRLKQPQCDNALSMIEVLRRSRYTLGPKELPTAWLTDQEQHYWRQRQLNHRGTQAFTATPMHSPRKINRARRSGPE